MRTCYLATIVLFVLIHLVIPNASADTFKPVWHVGDKWTVKAVFPSDPVKKEWSSFINFVYEVKTERHSGFDYLVIEINNLDGNLKFGSRLFFKKDEFCLTRAEIEKTTDGKRSDHTLTWDSPVPILTRHTLTPFDMPKFPIVSPSSQKLTIKKRIDDELSTHESVTQTVRPVKKEEQIPGIKNNGTLMEIRCLSGKGDQMFLQYWDTKLPWPVYGENDNMKYWLDTGVK